jgi:hypothetical protein
MTNTTTHILRARLDELDRAVLAAINFDDEFAAYLRFVAEVRDASASGGLQANGFPPAQPVPAPNADFVQPISEDAHQRREWNLQFNPTPVADPALVAAEPELPLGPAVAPTPINAEVTKAAP